MKRSQVEPTSSEREFLVEELFFSTTDSRGVITSGNDVFARVSGYPIGDLLGEPHNIIRHPDMPRAVFALLWNYLENGKTIGAYVKNMAKDGAFYWVFALASPIPNGYLSVRFKPTSPTLETVSALYAEMRKVERQHGDHGPGKKDAIQASTEVLLKALRSLGFNTYDEFMSTVLCAELGSRDAKMQSSHTGVFYGDGVPVAAKPGDSIGAILEKSQRLYRQVLALYSGLDDFSTLRTMLEKNASFSEQLTKTVRLISLNIAVESARLGDLGRTLAVIATHMDSSSMRIGDASDSLRGIITGAVEKVQRVMFHLAATRVQLEMVLSFCSQSLSASEDHGTLRTIEKSISDLQFGFVNTFNKGLSDLEQIRRELALLDRASEDLRKAVVMLRFAELGGTIESSRLDHAGSFSLMFEDVREKIDAATSQLAKLCEATKSVAPHIDLGRKVAELLSDQV